MGITSASTVALPVILNQKSLGTPDRSDRKATLLTINDEKDHTCRAPSKVEAVGFVMRNHCPKNAQFSELFRGEEVGNARYLDIGKLQMFLITLVLIGGYAFMLLGLFAHGSTHISSLPEISEGLVTLLLVSHAGYVANEAVPHSVSARAGIERESAVAPSLWARGTDPQLRPSGTDRRCRSAVRIDVVLRRQIGPSGVGD